MSISRIEVSTSFLAAGLRRVFADDIALVFSGVLLVVGGHAGIDHHPQGIRILLLRVSIERPFM